MAKKTLFPNNNDMYFKELLSDIAKNTNSCRMRNMPNKRFVENTITRATLISLPPLIGRQRIVTKIEEILPYCDKLTDNRRKIE